MNNFKLKALHQSQIKYKIIKVRRLSPNRKETPNMNKFCDQYSEDDMHKEVSEIIADFEKWKNGNSHLTLFNYAYFIENHNS